MRCLEENCTVDNPCDDCRQERADHLDRVAAEDREWREAWEAGQIVERCPVCGCELDAPGSCPRDCKVMSDDLPDGALA